MNAAFSAVLVSSCSCLIAASTSFTCFLAPVVSLSTESSIDVSFSSILKMGISHYFSATSFLLDRTWRNVSKAQTLSASKPLLLSFPWWLCCVNHFVVLPYMPTGIGEKFILGTLTIVLYVNFVVGWDVGCCMMWIIWRQAVSFMSTLVQLIILNKARFPFWLSMKWE